MDFVKCGACTGVRLGFSGEEFVFLSSSRFRLRFERTIVGSGKIFLGDSEGLEIGASKRDCKGKVSDGWDFDSESKTKLRSSNNNSSALISGKADKTF